MMEIEFGVLVLLIMLSAFFSGTETALMSVTGVKVRTLVRQKKKGSDALHRLKSNPHRLLITILIGNNLVNIGAASLATVLFTELFGSSGIGIATGVMTFLVLVFGEITPKTFATQNAERLSLMIARPIEILSIILTPFVKFFELISRGMTRLLGGGEEKGLSEEDIRTIVTMGKEEGLLTKDTAEIMHNVLEFKRTRVAEIMTRKSEIKMIQGNAKLKDVLDFVVKTPFSVYPVYIKDKNDVVGILDVDDVLRYAKNQKLDSTVKRASKKVGFVPEAKEIDDLLVEFEGKEVPMAIVVNEYGNVSGLVTVEDILEEIVGEIFDKSKRSSIYVKKISDKVAKVDGKASVEEVNKILQLSMNEEKFNTIAGFVEHRLQRIPRKGERVELKNAVIEVEKATRKEIKIVKITRKE